MWVKILMVAGVLAFFLAMLRLGSRIEPSRRSDE